MTENEVKELLAVVTSYDNRKVGRGMVSAWTESAQRGRWTFDEACNAVHGHYAEQTAYIMPGVVTDRIRAARRASRPALPAGGTPASPIHRAKMKAWVAQQLGWPRT
jgi:hypothetical protein